MQDGSVFNISSEEIHDGYISFQVSGEKAHEKFRYESGGHRFQRVPPSESKGRYHTSTITVVVLKSNVFSDITIRESDLEWQYCRGSGKGGQNRNKRDTAVWLKHKPSGIQIRSEEGRTQGVNKSNALNKLKEKLINSQKNGILSKNNQERKNLSGTGERGDKIRTIRIRDNTVKNHLNGKKMKYTEYIKGDLSKILE